MSIAWTKGGRDRAAINAAKTKYNAKAYDQLKIYVRKGGRDAVQALAEAAGMSMAEYIRHCVIADAKARGYDVSATLGGGGGDILTQIKADAAAQLAGQCSFGI